MTGSNAFSAWPSLLITGVMMLLWLTSFWSTIRAFRDRPDARNFRELVVVCMVMVVVGGVGFATIAAWSQPTLDRTLVVSISVARVALLITAAWLFWDRRHRPKE